MASSVGVPPSPGWRFVADSGKRPVRAARTRQPSRGNQPVQPGQHPTSDPERDSEGVQPGIEQSAWRTVFRQLGTLGWSWSDVERLTWKELNWAWEAATERDEDALALVRLEIQKVYSAVCGTVGVRAPVTPLDKLNPLKIKR